MLTSFITAITTAVLLAGGSAAAGLQVLPRSNTGTLIACENANLQGPCQDFDFTVDTCTEFTGLNDIVRSIALKGDPMQLVDIVLDCTLYACVFVQLLLYKTVCTYPERRDNCTNGGLSVPVHVLVTVHGTPVVKFNVPDDLKDQVSNFQCRKVLP
ncbi:hypothetical protein C8J57DRAFT_1632416 [Mycena rebaudengoi]|nr:hypothetical protein C8J57DRAFT_1632416 [Mycena rebaudengoi]